jgi:hypothetical protein
MKNVGKRALYGCTEHCLWEHHRCVGITNATESIKTRGVAMRPYGPVVSQRQA